MTCSISLSFWYVLVCSFFHNLCDILTTDGSSILSFVFLFEYRFCPGNRDNVSIVTASCFHPQNIQTDPWKKDKKYFNSVLQLQNIDQLRRDLWIIESEDEDKEKERIIKIRKKRKTQEKILIKIQKIRVKQRKELERSRRNSNNHKRIAETEGRIIVIY